MDFMVNSKLATVILSASKGVYRFVTSLETGWHE